PPSPAEVRPRRPRRRLATLHCRATAEPGTLTPPEPRAIGVRSRAPALGARNVALLVGVAHLCWATAVGIVHPGLGYEPDLVANWLYFQRLLAGDRSFARLWYFNAPKVLLVFLLGPFADTAGVPLITACAAALLAGSLAYLVARAASPVWGLVTGLL